MGLRNDKKAAMRAAIIDTTLLLFRTLGYHGARIQDVVRLLRISEATFFNYFPSKQSVLEAAALQLVNRSLDGLRTELDDDRLTAQERLEHVGRDFASNFEGDHELAVLLAEHTRLLLVGSNHNPEGTDLLNRLFATAQGAGEIRSDVSPEQLTDLYLAHTLVTINGWISAGDDREPLDTRLRSAQRIFWTGATAQVASPPRSPRRPRRRPSTAPRHPR
jgi:AcrR family transcriptional regulator